MAEYDAVVFDLDNTICVHQQDDEEIHEKVFERAGVGQFFQPSDLYALDTDDLPTANSHREYFEHVYRALAEEVGGDPDHAEPLAAATVEVLDYTQVEFREGAETALARATENGPVGLVTNGGEEVQTTKLSALGIRDAFDVEVFCDPGEGIPPKPDPTPLSEALDELGTDPARTLKVGDALELDVAGARAVGMAAAWVPTREPTTDPDPAPDYTLDSVDAVADLL
ncbi:HAD family hydrolase [Halobacteriales archaeon QS_1_68_20]|nr:MAG: HAD family hydrolase [Halobacteriales archaeon QS_1_68_20]